MMTKKVTFHVGSRSPFPEEMAFVDAVKREVGVSAAKHGKRVEASATFKTSSGVMATPTVHRQAVDIVRSGSVSSTKGSRATAAVDKPVVRVSWGREESGSAAAKNTKGGILGRLAAGKY
jgi:hypothetical protein